MNQNLFSNQNNFTPKRAVLFGLVVFIATLFLFPSKAYSQSQIIGFKAGYSDFRFDEVIKSYITQEGGLLELTRNQFAGTGGLGGDFIYISENKRFMGIVGAEYKSSNLFGSSGFSAKYSPPDLELEEESQELRIRDVSSFFRTTYGFGINLLPDIPFFAYVNPNLDIQYGQKVFMEDAYQAFVDRGYSDPGDYKVENSILIGVAGRLHTGFWLDNKWALSFSPGIVWAYRFDESFTGFQYQGIESQGPSWGLDFSFSLLYRSNLDF